MRKCEKPLEGYEVYWTRVEEIVQEWVRRCDGEEVPRVIMGKSEEVEDGEKSGLREIWETVPTRSRSEEREDLERWITSVEQSD